jgi:Ca2+-dependent lipid-binding protein
LKKEYKKGNIESAILGVRNVIGVDLNGKSDPYIKIIFAD